MNKPDFCWRWRPVKTRMTWEAVRLLEGMKRDDERNHGADLQGKHEATSSPSAPFSRFNASHGSGLSGSYSQGCQLLCAILVKSCSTTPLKFGPGVADGHLLKAYYLHDRKEVDPAIEATLRALALDPDYAKAWLALGYFRMELNEFPAALSAFQKRPRTLSRSPPAPSVLAVITAIEHILPLSTAQNSRVAKTEQRELPECMTAHHDVAKISGGKPLP